MRWARSLAFAAVWASSLTGCFDSSTNPPARYDPQSPAMAGLGTASGAGGDCGGLPVAPDSVRVDLVTPSFSNPLDASNPLFPVGVLDRAVFRGLADGELFRSETTRLPGTRTLIIDGEPVETLISQYVAWVDRRIEEVAIDLYGQDDEGNVWYFGEDVFNYEDGVVADNEGTWHAGVEGPAAMIMPADPKVGDVWRPENACPIVFEEVTALQTGVAVDGPNGPVAGALIVEELHMDGTLEDKTFAPGYGEFSTGSGPNVEALAVAVPVNFLGGDVPEALDELSDGAETMFLLLRNGGWRQIASLFEEMEEDWRDYEATSVPPLLAAGMNDALGALGGAIDARSKKEARQAAVDVALACVDFELRHEERAEIDLDLIEVWSRQLQIDTAAHDEGAILSDLVTIRVIRDRLEPGVAGRVDGDLSALRGAARAGDEGAVSAGAAKLSETVARISGDALR